MTRLTREAQYNGSSTFLKAFPKNGNNGIKHSRRDREVLDYLFSQQDRGASVQKVAANLKITYDDTKHVFARLTKSGEIFREGKVYKSTVWAMDFDPKPLVETLHEELERDLFGPEPTPRVRAFLTEFSAAAKLGLSIDESFHLAQRKVLESEPHGVKA